MSIVDSTVYNKSSIKAGKAAQQVKTFARRTDSLIWAQNHRITQRGREEPSPENCPLTSMCVLYAFKIQLNSG